MADTPPSGFDRVIEAMALPVGIQYDDPLVQCVITGLMKKLSADDRALLRYYYRTCRVKYCFTAPSARRATAVQIVIAVGK